MRIRKKEDSHEPTNNNLCKPIKRSPLKDVNVFSFCSLPPFYTEELASWKETSSGGTIKCSILIFYGVKCGSLNFQALPMKKQGEILISEQNIEQEILRQKHSDPQIKMEKARDHSYYLTQQGYRNSEIQLRKCFIKLNQIQLDHSQSNPSTALQQFTQATKNTIVV